MKSANPSQLPIAFKPSLTLECDTLRSLVFLSGCPAILHLMRIPWGILRNVCMPGIVADLPVNYIQFHLIYKVLLSIVD